MLQDAGFTFSNEPVRYDEARVARLDPIQEAITNQHLPLLRSRKLNTILTALEVQIEDGGDHPEVNRLLGEALRAALRHQVGEERAQEAFQALDTFEQVEAERWEQVRAGTLPEVPPSPEEQFEGLVSQGYSLLKTGDIPAGCDRWLEAWDLVKELTRPEWRTLEDFNRGFLGLFDFLPQWSQDVDDQLALAARLDPAYHEHRLRYAREFLERFPDEEPEAHAGLLLAQGEALWGLGQREEAEAVFAQVIERFPDEGWAYIRWAQRYWARDTVPKNFLHAEAILQRALARPHLADRMEVLENLEEVYHLWGKREEQAAIATQIEWLAAQARPAPAGPPGAPAMPLAAAGKKLPRNAPCWCGSGKKDQKCHLAADEVEARR
ncbi:MAG: tetratricopeptide repeat protein [Chloroflexi bacterium]|nr:tetratricopeptide repeat protein [Chloroflexota bacterium]